MRFCCIFRKVPIIKDHLVWVISEFDLEFIKGRPLWSSMIEVKIKFREISPLRIYVDYEIDDVRSGETFVHGSSVWVILNEMTRRPFSGIELLKEKGITADGKHDNAGKRKLPADKTYLRSVEHSVNVTDLDFNGHVCNRSYLSIGMATLPVDFVRKYSPHYIRLKFAREAFMGETLTCKVSGSGPLCYWFDIVNGKGKDICNIYAEWKEDVEELKEDVAEVIGRE